MCETLHIIHSKQIILELHIKNILEQLIQLGWPLLLLILEQKPFPLKSYDPSDPRSLDRWLFIQTLRDAATSAGMLLIALCLLIIELAWLRPQCTGL